MFKVFISGCEVYSGTFIMCCGYASCLCEKFVIVGEDGREVEAIELGYV